MLEYVIVHEMVHLVEPTHSERFIGLLNEHYPAWREARSELNELPLGAVRWRELEQGAVNAWFTAPCLTSETGASGVQIDVSSPQGFRA